MALVAAAGSLSRRSVLACVSTAPHARTVPLLWSESAGKLLTLNEASSLRYLNAATGKAPPDDAATAAKQSQKKTKKKKKKKGWNYYLQAQRRAKSKRKKKIGNGAGGRTSPKGGSSSAKQIAGDGPRSPRGRGSGRRRRNKEEDVTDHPLLIRPPALSDADADGIVPSDSPYYRYLHGGGTEPWLLGSGFVTPPSHCHSLTSSTRGRHLGRPLPREPLPILDASPLLDPSRYCRSSARPSGTTTISGGDAARRLLEGRRMCTELIGGRLTNYHGDLGDEGGENSDVDDDDGGRASDTVGCKPRRAKGGGGGKKRASKRGRQSRRAAATPPLRAFVLSGHGVPVQLLRDHVDCADGLLRNLGDAAEVSFNNYGEEERGLDFDWMRVRSRGGDNNPFPWPPRDEWYYDLDPSSWDGYVHRVDMYLAVMNRLAVAFGTALEESCQPSSSTDAEKQSRQSLPPGINGSSEANASCGAGYDEGFGDDESDSPPEAVLGDDDEYEEIDSGSGDSFGHVPCPRRWNVEFLRGFAYPPRLIPDLHGGTSSLSRDSLISPPIVELTQRGGTFVDGHVRISMQGFPSSFTSTYGQESSIALRRRRQRRAEPLTVIFDAKFGESENF